MACALMRFFLVFLDLERQEKGQDLVEYALLAALIALVCISGIQSIASAVNTAFVSISNSLT